MDKSPTQSIFDTVFITSLNLGYDTYDYLPPRGTSYPFVYVGEQFDNDAITKTNVYGFVTQTIHIYHTHRKRREVTDMINALKIALRNTKRADNYRLSIKGNINGQIIIDNSSGEPLLHGIIEVEFRYN